MNFRMTSFADNYEDVVLDRVFGGRDRGFYIDVGAYDPVEHSVTKHFANLGWRGINIEPNPKPMEKLRADRPRDVNLQVAVSDAEGEVTLYEAPDACWSADRDLLTGYFGARPDQLEPRRVPMTTLTRICDQHVPEGETIDFLKVDVEGLERSVIAGNDWDRWRPRVVLVEANNVADWEPILLAHRYQFTLFDGVNRFYLRDEDRELTSRMQAPANASDRFMIHGYMQRIDYLERHIESMGVARPFEIEVARWLGRVRDRHPRVAGVIKPIVRRVLGRAG